MGTAQRDLYGNNISTFHLKCKTLILNRLWKVTYVYCKYKVIIKEIHKEICHKHNWLNATLKNVRVSQIRQERGTKGTE